MVLNKKVVVVMPAYNAAKTLESTYQEIDKEIVDEVILVDDFSKDQTVAIAKNLGIYVVQHSTNLGYGANQKTCYKIALERGADIVVMLHPDYQYTPKLIPAMCYLIATGLSEIVLGSRILGGKALQGGMPVYKYVSNRLLTFIQNLFTGMKLSEFHTGYRAFSRRVLLSLPLEQNDNDFIFDNQLLVQAHWAGLPISEITCPTKYFPEASSINFSRSIKYGLHCLFVTFLYVFAKFGIYNSPLFPPHLRRTIR